MTGTTLLGRVRSLVTATPFSLVEAPEPFDFDRVPATAGDAVRVTLQGGAVQAGLAYSEERFDTVTVWVARDQTAAPSSIYASLLTLSNSLVSAIVHDGAGVGDFATPDEGRDVAIAHDPTAQYQVLRLTVPVSYMLEV